MKFQPDLAELVSTGATATLLLDGVTRLCNICVDVALKKMDTEVNNGTLTPDKAVALVSEITAYRRIVYRQQQEINMGKAASVRLAEGN